MARLSEIIIYIIYYLNFHCVSYKTIPSLWTWRSYISVVTSSNTDETSAKDPAKGVVTFFIGSFELKLEGLVFVSSNIWEINGEIFSCDFVGEKEDCLS